MPPRQPTFQVHVDVDNWSVYEEEFGATSAADCGQIYEEAMPRALELFESRGIRATFFIIGKDLEHRSCREFCRSAAKRGHELANHTYSHPTNLHRLTYQEKEYQLKKCDELLADACGRKPTGFRAPGYYLDDEIVDLLLRSDYLYDSSVLPSYANHLMKWYIALSRGGGLDKAFGRTRYLFASQAVTFVAPLGHPGKILYELPITTLPFLRMPIHSTFLYALGPGYQALVKAMARFFPDTAIFVFHAIDFVTQAPDSFLEKRVPTLKLPITERMRIAIEILDALKSRSCVTAADYVRSLNEGGVPASWLLSHGLKPCRR